jgi:hypothetical protein
MSGDDDGQDSASQIDDLHRRAAHARRLAKAITDSLAKVGLFQVAEEYERQIIALQTRAKAGSALATPPPTALSKRKASAKAHV